MARVTGLLQMKKAAFVLGCCLLAGAKNVSVNCDAQDAARNPGATNAANISKAQELAASGQREAAVTEASAEKDAAEKDSPIVPAASGQDELERETSAEGGNRLGRGAIKNLFADQKAIWTSPSRLRWADGTWLFPLAAATAGFLATDRAAIRALPNDTKTANRYSGLSNYGLGALVGAGGGLYLWGRISQDEHERETGFLAGEAAIDSFAVNTALQYSFARARPYQDSGRAQFFHGGTSFPSDHAAVSWSIASVIAHEYPGPLTQILVYGLATAISASRVMGQDHFPSDVVVGSAIGWLIGRQVYSAHHDRELAGNVAGRLSGDEGEERRDRRDMGSPFVPLDHWAYPALEKLAAWGYVSTAIVGLQPWTRIECARLADEAAEALESQARGGRDAEAVHDLAAGLVTRLDEEFAYELARLNGGHNESINLESVYTRVVSISGPALDDSYHFGQTIAYDFGRPFARGTNAQAGGSFSASAGPLVVYVRAEYQHAPAAPAPSSALLAIIAQADRVPLSQVPTGPEVPGIDRPELLDAYAAVNIQNWELILGRQSLNWGPGEGAMLWSDNIQPVNMVRVVNPEPYSLPGLLRHLGPVRLDQFFGRLDGHAYVRRPFEYGQKINLKPFSFLELGFGRRATLGGTGSGALCAVDHICGDPLTLGNLLHSYLGLTTGTTATIVGSVPGDNDTEMDWTFYVPKVRNYIVLYGDAYAEDDILPIQNPARNPWHRGIFITRLPRVPRLSLHVAGVSTEQAGLIAAAGGGNHGQFNYWNQSYPDGNTNGGNLIGNAVGRDGRSLEGRLDYSFSPRQMMQFRYRRNTIAADFIPGGAAWQDYALREEAYLRGGMYAKAELQYENISRYPALFGRPQANFTAIVELGFAPHKKERPQEDAP
jgi:membrane-associated phospholipid phosphatase